MPEPIETIEIQAVETPAKTEPAQVLGKDGKPFDPERAQHTIETLRNEKKAGDTAIARLAQIEADQKKAEEEAARQRGEFESIATTRTKERDDAYTERDAIRGERDAAFEIINRDVKARLEKLPEGVRKHVPAERDATPLQRLGKIAELEELADALKPAAPGNNPPRNTANNGVPREQPAQDKSPRPLGFL